MALSWPKNPKIEDTIANLDAVEARLKSLEQLVNSQGLMIGAQGTVIGDLGGKVETLRTWSADAQKAVADHWALREEIKARNAAARLADLEKRSAEAFGQVAKNTEAIQAVLTVLHPDPDHPDVPDSVPQGAWLHSLMMKWIETYGRLMPPKGR